MPSLYTRSGAMRFAVEENKGLVSHMRVDALFGTAPSRGDRTSFFCFSSRCGLLSSDAPNLSPNEWELSLVTYITGYVPIPGCQTSDPENTFCLGTF